MTKRKQKQLEEVIVAALAKENAIGQYIDNGLTK